MKILGNKEKKIERPGKEAAKEVLKKTDWSKHSPDRNNTRAVTSEKFVTRKDFDALQERVTILERLFAASGYVDVPGLVVTDSVLDPTKADIEIDKSLAASWTEPQMIAAATHFGLDLTPWRGQPREIRRRLYEEMSKHGVEMANNA